MSKLTVRWHQSIREIPESQWDALVGESTTLFYKWRWLDALEASESVAQKQGWQPIHLGLWEGMKPIAFAPLYLKGHSYGEFIFDQPFARLAHELRLNYYPKLIGMSPFSPIQGYKFFVAYGENANELTKLIFHTIDKFAIKNKIISCNFLYVDNEWRLVAEKAGCATWLNQQSLWSANNQENFSDYLASFNANQRRNIKKERKAVKAQGIKVSAITGDAIEPEILKSMYIFYDRHCAKWGPWGSKYLSPKFFEKLNISQIKKYIVLFTAFRDNPRDAVAMSLCVADKHHLWGRYWGSKEEINCLHFELCYYAPIEWALANGIKSFDPGAGGNHKRRRGFIAKPNFSLHRWYDQRMDKLIRSWLPQANNLLLEEINNINKELPLKSHGNMYISPNNS
ncbi:GNAT family N-acetyltransferase [Prochlorococcus sp. MIT 1300]|uniref:GNAT family N-acetyltransferase n=1 Tax=Prochlorococcus sp. MIT 1300 TaxID=3096218 RepID=UPI002A75678B|nr:GNAT family N-acetyltransferase [Prochlorococcus sp. MIT 1300]